MKQVLVLLLRAYRAVISPLYGQVCRYHPSCSAYALGAVETHGAIRGSWLAVRRLGRCHPWAAGGYDPVPARVGRGGSAEEHDHPADDDPEPAAVGAAVTPVPPATEARLVAGDPTRGA